MTQPTTNPAELAEPGPSGSGQNEEARIIRHGLLNAGSRAATGVLGIVLVPLMLRGLGTEMYGLWVAAIAACELIASMDLGLGWAVTRQVARGEAGETSNSFVLSAGNAFVFIGVAGMLLIATLGAWLPTSLGVSGLAATSAAHVLVALAISYGGETLFGYTAAVLYGVRRFALVSTLHTALAVGRTVGLLLLIMYGTGVVALAVWYAVATWIVAVAGYLAMAGLHPAFGLRLGRFSAASVKEHLEFSLSSQLTAFATSMVWRAPTLMLGFLRGAGAIPVYHIGQRLPLTVSGIGWRAAEAAFPAASEHQDRSPVGLSREVLTVSTRWSLLMILPAIVVMVVLASWFVRLWLGAPDAQVVAVLRITAFAVLANTLGAAALHVLWGRGRAALTFAVMAATAIVIVVLVWLLVPQYDAVGAAWATLPPMLLGSLVVLHLASRACDAVPGTVLRASMRGLMIPTVATGAVAYVLQRGFHELGWLAFIASASAAVTVFAASFHVLGTTHAERASFAQAWSRAQAISAWTELMGALRPPRFLRSLRDFGANARYYLFDRSHTTGDFYDSLFSRGPDPWRYDSATERGHDRFAGALALLRSAAAGDGFGSVLEIGCAEGRFTEVLAPHCRSLLAVDISTVALERARGRHAWPPTVEFRRWDLIRDALPGETFDAVVVMGVMENFVRLDELRLIRERLADLLRPGGVLLVESTRTGGDLENAWWRRMLHRGRWLNRFVGRHRVLEEIEERLSPIASQTAYRKRSS